MRTEAQHQCELEKENQALTREKCSSKKMSLFLTIIASDFPEVNSFEIGFEIEQKMAHEAPWKLHYYRKTCWTTELPTHQYGSRVGNMLGIN